MTTRRIRTCAAAAVGSVALATCASHSPTEPSPAPAPCTNTAPVILSITAQGARSNEPADFADVGESIAIAADVQDAETPVAQLQMQWNATAGTITGFGTNVTWEAPAKGAVSTPMDVTVTLTVVEIYTCAGQSSPLKNTVSATRTISVHDSAKEVGDMATQFLVDFSNSNVDVATVMRNFDLTCGSFAASEADQVALNRKHFEIARWNVGAASVTVPFGNSFCPSLPPPRSQRGDACASNHVHWESTIIVGPQFGDLQIADGIDWVSAYYHSDIKSWKLCDSQFTGTCMDVTKGIVCSDDVFPSMVPGRIK